MSEAGEELPKTETEEQAEEVPEAQSEEHQSEASLTENPPIDAAEENHDKVCEMSFCL